MADPANPHGLQCLRGLPGLPVEIMEFVVEHMLESHHEGSLAALAATCWGLHTIVMPRLYSKESMQKHPALIFWAAQLGRFHTAKRLVEAGVNLNRGMIRNESLAVLTVRTADFSPRQLYRDYRHMHYRISPHDTPGRVGPRGFVGEPFKLRPNSTGDGVGYAPWRSSWFPLHLAVRGGFADLVDLFISSSAFLDVPSSNLCSCNHPSFFLAAHNGLSPYRISCTPLHTAICNHHTGIAKTLLERGASISFGSMQGLSRNSQYPYTVLHNAARTGATELVEFILENKYQTEVQVMDPSEMSPLWHAYMSGHWDVVDALLARGADINDDLAAGYTPLTDACFFGEFPSALALIARGADVNVACTAVPTVFTRARSPYPKALLVCLRGHRPIDMCCLKQQGATRSIRYQRHAVVNPRFQPPPDPMLPPPRPEPLPIVDESLRITVVRALLDASADLGACKNSPSLVPPIVAAAAEHLVDVVRLLLDRGAEVDSTDKDGNTPLMAALNYSLHWCHSHAKVGPLSTRPFGLQRPARQVQAPNIGIPAPPGLPPPPLPPGAVLAPPVQVAPPGLPAPPGQPGHPPWPVHLAGHAPPPPVIVIRSRRTRNPEACRHKGDFTACVELLIERGAKATATNDNGASPLSLVYSPDPSPDKRYQSGHPRGYLTFKERTVVVSLLLDLGADPNTQVHIVRPDGSDNDVVKDDDNVYSASDSNGSLDTATGSYSASSQASFRPPLKYRYRSLYKYGPLSVLQCAFWDGDLDLCRSLLARGAELTTPLVTWMLHVTWVYCRWWMRDAAERVTQVLGDLDVSVQTELGAHPPCLYVLISQGVQHLAEDLLASGIEREKFDFVPGPHYEWLFDDESSRDQKWGYLCLSQAVRNGWYSTVEALLQLGIDVNTPGLEPPRRPLDLAIRRHEPDMIELLIRQGVDINLSDDNETVRFSQRDGKYPLFTAIGHERADIIRALLVNQTEPLPERFAFAYIKEAYMTRRVRDLNTLLTFTCLDPNAKSPSEGNTHLIEIMKNVSAICNRQETPEDDSDSDDGMWEYSIMDKFTKVKAWIQCLVLLARVRISPLVANEAGMDALEFFAAILNYKGPDRFNIYVRSALRSRLNEVMGEAVWEDSLDAAAAFEALTEVEVNLADSEESSSGGEIDDG